MFGFVALLVLFAICCPFPAAAQRTLAVVGGVVIDGTGAPPRPNAAIVIEGDRIRAVGQVQTETRWTRDGWCRLASFAWFDSGALLKGTPLASSGNEQLEVKWKPIGPEEERMRQFFLDRVRMDPLMDGQNYIYMHYADMIANGYHRTAPCPFQTQGIMLNPNGDLFFCENSDVVGNVKQDDAEAIYFRASSQEHRRMIRDEKCPTCLSPCQMNVAAIKQVVPYARFLVRASIEKRRFNFNPEPPPPAETRASL